MAFELSVVVYLMCMTHFRLNLKSFLFPSLNTIGCRGEGGLAQHPTAGTPHLLPPNAFQAGAASQGGGRGALRWRGATPQEAPQRGRRSQAVGPRVHNRGRGVISMVMGYGSAEDCGE